MVGGARGVNYPCPQYCEAGRIAFTFTATSRTNHRMSMWKFWLQSVALARNSGFAAHELGTIQKLLTENRDAILEVWYGHFGANRG